MLCLDTSIVRFCAFLIFVQFSGLGWCSTKFALHLVCHACCSEGLSVCFVSFASNIAHGSPLDIFYCLQSPKHSGYQRYSVRHISRVPNIRRLCEVPVMFSLFAETFFILLVNKPFSFLLNLSLYDKNPKIFLTSWLFGTIVYNLPHGLIACLSISVHLIVQNSCLAKLYSMKIGKLSYTSYQCSISVDRGRFCIFNSKSSL